MRDDRVYGQNLVVFLFFLFFYSRDSVCRRNEAVKAPATGNQTTRGA